MSRFLARLFIVLGVAAAAAGWANATFAQTPIPPTHYTLDPRGVDLVSGKFIYPTTEVVIGQPGAGGLSYGRLYISGGGWRNTMLGTLNVSGSTYIVSIGGESEAFTKSGSTFTPVSNRGATLTQGVGTYTFTTSSGVVATFNTFLPGLRTPYTANTALLGTVTTPSGEITSYNYATEVYCREPQPDGECFSYGNALRLQSITNNHGYMLHLDYAANNPDPDIEAWLTLVSVTGLNRAVDACGEVDPVCYPPLTETWPSVTYGATSTANTATDQSGRTTSYTSTAGAFGIMLPGSSSNDISVTFTSGKVSALTDASGAWTYAYSTVGTDQTTIATGPLGQKTTLVASLTTGLATQATEVIDASAIPPTTATTAYQYDSQLRLSRITQPEGNRVDYTYDSRGNVTQTVMTDKAGTDTITISATYPSTCSNPVICNLPTSTTDPLGNVTNYAWNSTHGGLTSVTLPSPDGGTAARPQTRYSYSTLYAYHKGGTGPIMPDPNPVTLPTLVEACITGATCDGTAQEVQTAITYGSTGVANNLLPTVVSTGAGDGSLVATTTTTYDHNGDVETVDGPLSGSGDTTAYRYDTARQQVGVIGPDPDAGGALLNRAQRITYDPRGSVTLVEAGTTAGYTDLDWAAFTPLQRQQAVYDGLGRPVEVRQQSSGGTTYGVAQTTYDAAGRPSCVAVRMNPATFGSLPSSACTMATVGSYGPDRISQVVYDARSQVVSATTGLGAHAVTTAATYSANGMTVSLTDGNGNVSIPVYDGFDRLSRLRYPNATGGGTSTTDYEEYAYDDASNVVSYRDRANQTFTTAYDDLNRPINTGSPTLTSRMLGYDNLGRLTDLETGAPNAWNLSWTYDALGRQLTQTAGPAGATTTLTTQYDLAGRRTQLTWPDSVSATYVYDLYGATTAIKQGSSTAVADYAYDNLGRLTGSTRGNGAATSYTYDAVSRLSTLTQNPTGSTNDVTFTLGYNPAGQIISRSVSNSAYVFAPTTGTTGYVNNGLNRVTTAGGTSVTYDANGNVTSGLTTGLGYDAQNNLASAAGTATYGYDPLKRMFSQTISGTTTRFAYDGMKLATEYSGASGTTIAARHVPGLWMDDIAASYAGSGTGTPSWPLTDERGSVIALTDNTGAVTAINAYDEYGVPASGNTGRFQYTGQRWLPTAGLYDYKMRAYAAGAGRFVQADPLGYAAGANLYAYVGADPLNIIDPLGLCGVGDEPDCEVDEIVVTGRRPCDALCRISGGLLRWGGRQGNGARQRITVGAQVCTSTAPRVSPRRWARAFGSAGVMTAEFFFGFGPEDRFFGPRSPESALLASAPGIQDIFDAYQRGRNDTATTFGLSGLFGSRANPTRQFVGSFRGNVRPTPGGYRLTITNRTSWSSFTNHIGTSHSRDQGAAFGDIWQIYVIDYRCR